MVFVKIGSVFYIQNLLIKILKNQMRQKGNLIFSAKAEKQVSVWQRYYFGWE